MNNMRKAKRGGGDLIRSFHKNRKACDPEWVLGHLCDGDSNQDGRSIPFDWVTSDCCRSVVSISLCTGLEHLHVVNLAAIQKLSDNQNLVQEKKGFFACTGYFIDWNESTAILTSASLVRNSGDENKINESLRIEVLLPSMERKEGTLEHYNLHYNVALAGIGGPLITLDGDVLGMNFYDKKIGTPFLSWRHICKILASFEGKRYSSACHTLMLKFAMVVILLVGLSGKCLPSDATDRFNRWPVPMPYWCLPKDKPEVHDDGDVFTVGYIMGTRTMLC
nr:unnamed protein product [Digitaria exilis]